MIKGAHRDSTLSRVAVRMTLYPHDVPSYFFVCSGFWDIKIEWLWWDVHCIDDHAISVSMSWRLLQLTWNLLHPFPLIFFPAEYVAISLSPFFVNVQLARRKIVAPQGEQEYFPLEGSFQWQCFVNRLFLMCRAPEHSIVWRSKTSYRAHSSNGMKELKNLHFPAAASIQNSHECKISAALPGGNKWIITGCHGSHIFRESIWLLVTGMQRYRQVVKS